MQLGCAVICDDANWESQIQSHSKVFEIQNVNLSWFL